jgi:hypothetical protein
LDIESAEKESDISMNEYFSSKEDFTGLGIWLEAWLPMIFRKIEEEIVVAVHEGRPKK